jgi:hypothetical protein
MAKEEPKARGTIVADPELKAMASIDKALRSMTVEGRERVLRYLQSRWSFPIVDQQKDG